MIATSALQPEQRILLRGVSWQTYARLVAELEDRAGVRLTFDRGSLELMSPSRAHERIKGLLGRLIETFTLELGIPLAGGGSTTFGKEDLDRGLEPDECYWLKNEAAVRRRDEIDLAVDPPPDLAIEVEITRSAIDKLSVYSALGVPEVWRHDGKALTILVLDDQGRYQEAERSVALPSFPLEELARTLARREELDETSLVRAFQIHVRDRIGKG